MDLIVVVPAYNEEDNIGIFLDRIQTLPKHLSLRQIIVVDDGSMDKTQAVVLSYADKLPVTMARHQVNQGVNTLIAQGIGGGVARGCIRQRAASETA